MKSDPCRSVQGSCGMGDVRVALPRPPESDLTKCIVGCFTNRRIGFTEFSNEDDFRPNFLPTKYSCNANKMLYLVGLGLSDETDITVKGLEIVKKASRVYLEAYTSILLVDQSVLVSLSALGKFRSSFPSD